MKTSLLTQICSRQNEPEDAEANIEVEWYEEEEETVKDVCDIAYIANEDLKEVGKYLANTSFLHGRMVKETKETMVNSTHTKLSRENMGKFEGIRLDTCSNKASIMCYSKYTASCSELSLRREN